DDNGLGRQLNVRIELLDRRVIPALDSAEVNLRDGGAIEHKLPWRNAVKIDCHHYPAHNGRKLNQTIFVKLLALERHVGGAKGDGFGLDLFYSAAGPNRLIIEHSTALVLIAIGPLRIDGIRKRGTSTGDSSGPCFNGAYNDRQDRGCARHCLYHVAHWEPL